MTGDEQKDLDQRFIKAAANGEKEQMRFLLLQGANINARLTGILSFGETSLGSMVWKKNPEMMQFLIELGADLNAAETGGMTPIHRAIDLDRTEIAILLLDAGADETIENGDGVSAKRRAQKKGDQDFLLKVEAKEQDRKAAAVSAAEKALLSRYDAEISAHEVTLERKAGGVILREIFNFAARDRLTLVYAVADGPVQGVVRQSFSAIDDQDGLRRAFHLYRERGGKLEERNVFPGHPLKSVRRQGRSDDR